MSFHISPELAEALPALRSFSEGWSEAEGEASGQRKGLEILRFTQNDKDGRN